MLAPLLKRRAFDGSGVADNGLARISGPPPTAAHHRRAERAYARRAADRIAYLLLADRKIWAAVQIRRGPNVVGPWGLLQSFADLLKFAVKEPIIPDGANKGVFLLAPLVTCVLALAAWAVIPVASGWMISDINVGILYLFAISSLGVYGIIMGGWASNSKYPFLAALRSAAQMVSYEVSIGFVMITVLLCVGSLNLSAWRRRTARLRPARPGTGCRCSRCS